MPTPDLKAIKKIAATCRKLGIKHFKGDGFEFTLSDEPPPTPKATKRNGAPAHHIDPFVEKAKEEKPETRDPTPEELMFWSTGELIDEGIVS